MNDCEKSKEQLIRELRQARERISQLQAGNVESLRVSEEKYRGLINNLSEAVFECDTDGRILFSSPQISNIIGLKLEEVVGQSGFEFVHPDDVDDMKEVLREALTYGHAFKNEFRIRHKEGHYVPVGGSGRVVYEAGEARIIGTVGDISERKRAQQALQQSHRDLAERVKERTAQLKTANTALKDRIAETEKAKAALVESEAKLSRLLENLPDFITVVDRQATIIYANRPAPDVSIESMLGSTGFSHIREEYLSVCRKAFQGVLLTGDVGRVEMRSVYDEFLDCRLMPLKSDGEVSAVMIICTDITEQRKADNLMIAQRNLSEKLSTVSDLTEAMGVCLETALSVADFDGGGSTLSTKTVA